MNYAALRTQFLAIVNRTDCTDTLAKLFFDQGIQRCQRELRLPHMERLYTIDTSSADIDSLIVPSDWVETITVVVAPSSGTAREVQYLDLGSFARQSNLFFGATVYYTRKYDHFDFIDPIPQGSTAYLVYYGDETPLVNDTDESTLAKVAPDLLIYAALTYASDYFIDTRGDQWEQKWQFFREQIQSQATDGESATGSNAVQPFAHFSDGTY